jgi:hypothetical protein
MRAEIATIEKLPLLCAYMLEKTGVEFDPRTVQGFAVMSDEGKFSAAVLVSNVRCIGNEAVDCEISCATETSVSWSPEVCTTVFTYVFAQLGCKRCTSITRKNNTKSRKFLEALNFQLEGCIRKGYDGQKDALVYGLLAEDCEFVRGLNGQINS